ncbi:non-canonical purine NTP diphosphatase [Halosquirtibacter xylanolyticus]|uniref:non-canonical purine NTP diphosphatase n=1 Tax=Halosquirtibacter xylanolyticus TaxID=3374599 RepID=UPI00374A6A3A|nr:non-canonical purine NTP diphosphatase [Prolixibacteraceae bacterium]
MEIIFATHNPNKLKEIQEMVGDTYQVLGLHDIDCHEEIAETASTLEGNALIKSSYIHEKYHHNCFSDDTGLEVESLNGAPGVYSARYAGPNCLAEDNMDKLLHELKGSENRKAQFRTVISLIIDDQKYEFEGVVKGEITLERSGKDGFGYDPIFQPEGYNKTFSEMSSSEKNLISHRGVAVRKLISFLKTYNSKKS